MFDFITLPCGVCSGYVAEYRNGDKKIILLDTDYGDILTSRDRNTYANLNEYDEDFKYRGDHQYDVVKVYAPKNKFRNLSDDYDNDYTLVWSAPTVRSMTMAEICDALGYDVEIIG